MIELTIPEETKLEQKPEVDLTDCPEEIRALDPNWKRNWHEFIKRTEVTMSVDKKRVIDSESRRARIIQNFGIPSLLQRLSLAKDEVARARVWWRESAACASGESIADLTSDTLSVLNPWLSPESKFKNARFAQLNERRAGQKAEQELRSALGTRICGNTSDGKHVVPSSVRSDAKYCDRACRQADYRNRKA